MHKYELIGYGLFFVGALIMITDPYAEKQNGAGNKYLGDAIAFIGAGFGAILGILNSRNSEIIHPIVLMCQVLFFSIFYQLTFGVIVNGPIFFSFHPTQGAFGWMTDPKLIAILL